MNIHVLHPDAPAENDVSHRAAMNTNIISSAVDDLVMIAVNNPEGRAAVSENRTELGRVILRLQLLLSSLNAAAH
jgi:hypothetical protein